MKDILVPLHSLHSKKEKRMNEGEQRENEIRIDVADGGGVGIPNFALRARCV